MLVTPSSNSNSSRANTILELVHSDICGSFEPSFGGKRYFITFIDDFSNSVFVSLLESRAQAVAALKDFLQTVAYRNIEVESIRTDKALEFIGGQFFRIGKEKGINHQLTAHLLSSAGWSCREDKSHPTGHDAMFIETFRSEIWFRGRSSENSRVYSESLYFYSHW